jgi:uncharacterized protein
MNWGAFGGIVGVVGVVVADFGIIVAMNVSLALLSALVVLPPMLVWADGHNSVSRGLVAPEVLAGLAPGLTPELAPTGP